MLRLFVGLAIPKVLGPQLASLNGGIPGARWVSPENLHLSLRFIGEVDEGIAEDVDTALGQIRAEAPKVALAGVGCFESRNRAHTIWAGVRPEPALFNLQQRVEKELQRTGLPPEGRKFMPHVTLARMKQTSVETLAPFLANHGSFRAVPFRAEVFSLYQVFLSRNEAAYQIIENYDLLT